MRAHRVCFACVGQQGEVEIINVTIDSFESN